MTLIDRQNSVSDEVVKEHVFVLEGKVERVLGDDVHFPEYALPPEPKIRYVHWPAVFAESLYLDVWLHLYKIFSVHQVPSLNRHHLPCSS